MAAPLDPAKVDDAIALYQSGKTADEVAAIVGIGKTSVYRVLRRHGLRARPKFRDLDVAAIVSRYLAGESELALSRAFGIDRNGIRRRLTDAGVAPRDCSAAMFVRMARSTPDERRQWAQASHDAIRGTKFSDARLANKALGIERIGHVTSKLELTMTEWLRDRGVDRIVPQKAIGPYNADIGAAPVAVEIYGGNWHGSGHHAERSPKRFRYILNQGWAVIVVWVNRNYPLDGRAANYVAAYIEEARGDPSLVGEYRVIRGDGQLVAQGRDDLDKLTVIPPLN